MKSEDVHACDDSSSHYKDQDNRVMMISPIPSLGIFLVEIVEIQQKKSTPRPDHNRMKVGDKPIYSCCQDGARV
jgi:hypothetical protein